MGKRVPVLVVRARVSAYPPRALPDEARWQELVTAIRTLCDGYEDISADVLGSVWWDADES